MKRKITLFILFFNFCQTIFSQHKKIIYVDETFNEITFLNFKKKINSNLFNTAIIETDSLIFKKLRYTRYFGRLPQKKHSDLKKIFTRFLQIDASKTVLLHYYDSIPSYYKKCISEKIPYKKSEEVINYTNKLLKKDIVFREVYKNPICFSKHKKCFHYKDYASFIKKTFSDGTISYNNMIIYPNGDFFSGRVDFIKLYKKKKYLTEKKKWLKKINQLN